MCTVESWWEVAVWHREPNLVLCDNIEGWDEGEVGRRIKRRGVYDWLTLLYGRNQHNIVKQLSSNLKQILKNQLPFPDQQVKHAVQKQLTVLLKDCVKLYYC